MSCDHTPLPLDAESNGARIATLAYDIAGAPMLIHALAIGANTVMMCGGGNAENRMRWYRDQIAAAAPPGWRHLRREEDLANIALAMAAEPAWSIHRKLRWENDDAGSSVITVGDRRWSTFALSLAQHKELAACIAAIAPVSCEQADHDNQIERSW